MKIFVTGAGGFIGGSIAAGLARDGHQVRGLVRRAEQSEELKRLGIEPVLGSLDDRALLIDEARAADAVINAASSDHRGAVEALIDGLEGSNKTLLHTSGSSIVGDASGGESSEAIYREDSLPEPTADKAPRVAIDNLVLDAAKRGVRSAVLCNTLIYGHGAIARRRACSCRACYGRQGRAASCAMSGRVAISGRTCISTMWSMRIGARSKRRRRARSISSRAAKRRSAK